MSEQNLVPEESECLPLEEMPEAASQQDEKIILEKPGKKAYRNPTSGIVWGLLLICLGVFFFLRELDIIDAGFNWWALFIVLPAFGFFSGAWEIFWRKRRLNHAVRSSFGSGLVVLTVALILLFDLSWRIWWPMMLIVPGFAIFLNGFVDRNSKKNAGERNWTLWNLWVGLAVMLLGVAFLGERLDLFNIREMIPSANWWAVFMALPGVGALLHAAIIAFSKGKHQGASLTLAVIGIALLSVAAVAYFSLNWNLILPVTLIGGGLAFVADTFVRTVFFKDNLQ